MKKRIPDWIMVDGERVFNGRGLSYRELYNWAHGKPPNKDMNVLRAIAKSDRVQTKAGSGKSVLASLGARFFSPGTCDKALSQCILSGYVTRTLVPAHYVFRLTDEGREVVETFAPSSGNESDEASP